MEPMGNYVFGLRPEVLAAWQSQCAESGLLQDGQIGGSVSFRAGCAFGFFPPAVGLGFRV